MSKTKKLTPLTSTNAVIAELGGTQAVADLTKRAYNAAFNWHAQHAFPSNTYVVMTAALAARGFCAPDSLWGMTMAAEAQVA
jgi:hypothetical protein